MQIETAVTVDSAWGACRDRAAGWRERAAAIEAAQRDALLARADAAFDGAEADRLVAIRVYVALSDTLDPECPEDCERAARLIAEGPALACVGAMEAMADRAVDREVGECARVVLAQRDLQANDLPKAEAAYRRAMLLSTDRWPLLRANAAGGYARFCLDAGRDVEALVLARRGAAASESVGDAFGAAFARLVEAHALRNLGDWPRLRVLIDRMRTEIERLPALGRRIIGFGVLAIAGDLALGEERLDDALALVMEAKEASRTHRPTAWMDEHVNLVRAEVLLRRGFAREAVEDFEIAMRALAGDIDEMRLQAVTGRMSALAAAGDPRAESAAAEWLADLEAVFLRGAAHGVVFREASRGAEHLVASGMRGPHERAACRIAASAALARLREIAAFAHDFPEFATPDDEERDVIQGHRERTERRADSLRATVARLLEDEIAAGRSPLAVVTAPTGFIAACAWCGHLRNAGGTWHPLPESLPSIPDGPTLLTHAICPPCRAATLPD